MAVVVALQGAPAAAAVFGAAGRAPVRSPLPDLGDAESDDLSPATERKLGDEIMRQAHEAGDVMEDAESSEYLNQFGQNLVAQVSPGDTAQPFRFFFVNDPSINAFALPGGWIGVNSGLIVATQSESELASVMAHEMGHVLQRHIARALARERQTSLLALAGMLLGLIVATRSRTVDAGAATIAAGQGLALQDQLDFGRDAEREADRVGFRILQSARYDVDAMPAFFARLQQVARLYDNGTPAFLQTHPLTTERIADIQDRARSAPYRQRADGPDFQFVRARMRVLQDTTGQGLRDARAVFEDQLKGRVPGREAAARYGLAVALLKQGDARAAQREIDAVRRLVGVPDALVDNLAIDVKQASGDSAAAVVLADEARRRFPLSRTIAHNYADTLQQAGRHDDAIAYLDDQAKLYRDEPVLSELLAKSHAARGDAMLSHRLLGEAYLQRGSFRAALQQMQIARSSAPADANFHEVSQIDARVRELVARVDELKKAEKEAGVRPPTVTLTTSTTSAERPDPMRPAAGR